MQEAPARRWPTVVTYFDWYLCVVPSTSAFTCIARVKHHHIPEQSACVVGETGATPWTTVCMPNALGAAVAPRLPAHLRRGALAVGVIEDNVLGSRQRGGRVHGWRHVQQRQLQVRWRRRRLLGVVLRCGQQLRIAAVQEQRSIQETGIDCCVLPAARIDADVRAPAASAC